MWADTDVNTDYLNFSEVADVVATMVLNEDLLPLSIGIYGGWGAGKSTVLRLIEGNLQAQNSSQRVVVVNFDAWLYQDFDDARAALMDVLIARLSEEVQDNKTLTDKARQLASRVDYFRAAGLLADIGLAAMAGVPPGIVSGLTGAAKKFAQGGATSADAAPIKKTAQETMKSAQGLLKDQQTNSPPSEITAFRSEFAEFIDELGAVLVVFIDNLDRCLPKKAIQTLEAVRLFLFLPSTAFVIAADEDMIRHAVREHYNDPSDRLVTDYLDKMVQIALRVPRVGVQELTAYLMLLFAEQRALEDGKFEELQTGLIERLRTLWKGEPITKEFAIDILELGDSHDLRADFDLAERLAPLLATSKKILGNPRIVKRLLNSIRIRCQIADQRGMPLDEALIAKVAIFERCTDEATFGSFCALINSASEGAPNQLQEMEKAIDNDEKFMEACPVELHGHVDFLRDWCRLPPALSNRDLRAAVYLSRDAAPLRVSAQGLSEKAEEALKALINVSSMSSPSAKAAAESMLADEIIPVIDALISDIRGTDDWSVRPRAFSGALLLADKHLQARTNFNIFLKKLPLPKIPPWLKAFSKKRSWLSLPGGN